MWKGLALVWLGAGVLHLRLLSKTVVATLPAAVLVIVWWKRGQIRWRDLAPLVPFFILGMAMGLMTAHLEQTHVGATGERVAELNLSIAQRTLIAGRVIWFYLGKLFWPHPLVFIYPRWDVDPHLAWQWVFPIAVVVALAALFKLRHRLGRGPLAAALIFCGTLFPAMGFLNVYPMRFSFVSDHFQYHASAAIIALVAVIIWKLARWWSTIILVPLSVLTFDRGFAYFSAQTLWRDTVVKNPNSWMVHTNLGHVLRDRGDYQGAYDEYVAALRLAPNIHDTETNVGMMLGFFGHDTEAIEHLRAALRVNPDFAPAHYSLGLIYAHEGKTDAASDQFRLALRSAGISAGELRPGPHSGLARAIRRSDPAAAHRGNLCARRPRYPRCAWRRPGGQNAVG